MTGPKDRSSGPAGGRAAPGSPGGAGAVTALSSVVTASADARQGLGGSAVRVACCPPSLQPFVDAGVLVAADVHVARTICELLDVTDEAVLLGVACAARAPRVGHSCLDVRTVADSAGREVMGEDLEAVEAALAALPWPDPQGWLTAIAASPVAGSPADGLPLVVEGDLVYLRRQHEQEVALAADLRVRVGAADGPVDEGRLAALLGGLFPGVAAGDPQLEAARQAVSRRLTVVTGGPGTGKTWTVARILAVLIDQAHAAGTSPQVALAAPTAKAAAQLSAGITDALSEGLAVPVEVSEAIEAVGRGQTIHGLLGRRTSSRFWHDRDRPLPHDIVVIDEVSMASLSLMTRLLEAIRPDARVVLIGDPDQLASVEAGSVLADVVAGLGDESVVRLTRVHRYGEDSGIAVLAGAIRDGDAAAAMAALRGRDDLDWIDVAEPTEADLAPVRALLIDRGRRMHVAADAGDAAAARACLGELVVLAAHRRGRWGVAGWNARVDGWLAAAIPKWKSWEDWQPGRTVLATVNDRSLGVFNGDLGVVIDTPDGLRLSFHDDPERLVAPARLQGHEIVHALTIHKSQGSQWDHVIVGLPSTPSRILTRQLLYTAVTRAAEVVTAVGVGSAISTALTTPILRSSGLAAAIGSVGSKRSNG